jgi:hypothetical protein
MQGWMRGVRPGWKLTAINGQQVQDYDDIEAMLLKVEKNDAKYELVFAKGGPTFGINADQAANKADAEKDKNRSRLRRTFAFQSKIERAEHRGITCAQLDRVVNYAREHSSKWRDTADAKDSPFAGQRLRMDFLNLHHINAWILTPATEARKCSFVELLTKQKQSPVWYVNHHWGESFVDFLGALKAHSSVRNLIADTPLWIGAFACRPHGPSDDLQGEVRHTGFFQALKTAQFRMLFVLDKELVALSRLWCTYEASLCLGQPTLPMDIVISGEGGRVITQGLTEAEEELEQRSIGSGIKAKLTREADFPVGAVLEAALEIKVERCKVSQDDDRRHILNSIAGHGFKIDPVETHPCYDEVNLKLRGLFAGHLLFMSTTRKQCRSDDGWNRIAQAMTGDTREYLDLHLEGCTPESLQLLARCIPETLRYLKLRLRGSSINNQNMFALADACQSLKAISVDLRDCDEIDMAAITSELAGALKKSGVKVDVKLAESEAAQFVQDVEQPRRNMAKAFGVAICDPEECAPFRHRMVPLVPALCKTMSRDPKAHARLAAVQVMASLGERAQSAAAALEKAIHEDEDPSVQKAARHALAKVNGDLIPKNDSKPGSKESSGVGQDHA